MARDGTNRGGRRIRAGDKPEPLADKIVGGRTAHIMEFPMTELDGADLVDAADLYGEEMPTPSEFLSARQRNGKPLGADEIFRETWLWLKERGCERLVNPRLIESYAQAFARFIQCEEAMSQYGLIGKHPTTGGAIASPFVQMGQAFQKQSNLLWYEIFDLRSSLREFGFVNPVIIDREFNVIAGHGRILAAKEENIEQIPCVFVDHLTEAQKKAYILADNRFALDAGWDEDMLRVEMEALQGMDFDISLTGFDEAEIADLFAADDNEAQEDAFDEDAALQAEPFVKTGDLWILGRHRLLCADSTNTEDVKLLMDGKKANVCITDPPYACNYTGGTGMKIMNDNLKGEEFYQFLLSAFKNAYENLADGAAIYIFHSDAEKVNFYNAVVAAGFHYSTTCIWVKQSLVLGRFDYQMRHEPVIYAFKDTVKHKFYGDRKQTTVWEFDRPSKSKLHPTTKPLPLIAYPMKNSSLVNSIVLDLFGGSGSTLMAAEQMDRTAYLMELDPVYASAIVRRFVAYRGNTEDDVIRDGKTLPCSEVYIPTAEDLGMKDTTINDIQKGRKKGG